MVPANEVDSDNFQARMVVADDVTPRRSLPSHPRQASLP